MFNILELHIHSICIQVIGKLVHLVVTQCSALGGEFYEEMNK